MVQRTVLKVDIACQKCKKKLLKAVSGLEGVDKIEIDAAKGTLTVTGDADPYEIIVRTRKAGKIVEVVSVGPPPAPQKQDAQKKPDDKKPEEKKLDPKADIHMPHNCPVCQRINFVQLDRWNEPNPSCSIM
ncbi:heavy metal-associated isoprenylated plant protein 43 [Ziziphus jujuba]|uniref:Heavy metal-associated isoprenylated plant protein 43 n=2 Tax=Ziziphus jujuba TaxID=326968 RepID=A0A6P4AV89_ZIZJJ|nr:heavy metal-associated isoprenylated plant protein 43 [Ziziphus jujuba]KAH7520001.1 hypothetical protein FEM48_Zijuj08G0097300 [Ziziphus jujuba var. spinosa]